VKDCSIVIVVVFVYRDLSRRLAGNGCELAQKSFGTLMFLFVQTLFKYTKLYITTSVFLRQFAVMRSNGLYWLISGTGRLKARRLVYNGKRPCLATRF
jgi:hypothetical protein